MEALPLLGSDSNLKVNSVAGVSTSSASSPTVIDPPSETDMGWSGTTGKSLTGVTVILTVAALESDNVPSLTVYVNESLVVSLPLWIYLILPFPRSIIFPFVG